MAPVGAFALLDCKPRQGRKAATVVIDASAEGVLTGATFLGGYAGMASFLKSRDQQSTSRTLSIAYFGNHGTNGLVLCW